MDKNKDIRIDKFLWSVRIYKTRSMASAACSKGRITINSIVAKPSRIIQKDDTIQVKKPPVNYSYRVICPIGNRVSAKLVENYIIDITPAEEKEKLEISRAGSIIFRGKGSGRPTKKERREIDKLNDDY